ncbi:MAG: hypothetical protein II222_05085 [Paraprevotella sp.]|nr:hypothetical protein [Paraprevotella sp.]
MSVQIRRTLWLMLYAIIPVVICAQRYCAVAMNTSLEHGKEYLIGAEHRDGTLRLMAPQPQLGTSEKSRMAVSVQPASDGTFTLENVQAATFVVEEVQTATGSSYYKFRDTATGGYLAYDTRGSSSNSSAPLYTVSDDQVTSTLRVGFALNYGSEKDYVTTYEKIKYSESTSKNYRLYATTLGDVFKLYHKSGLGAPLRFYVEVVPPTIQRDVQTGVCTFEGMWTAEELTNVEWTRVKVADLTQIDLPEQEWKMNGQPSLVYVRNGQAERLPVTTENVVEMPLDFGGGACVGKALTPIRWDDNDTVSIKYPFDVEQENGISYERMVLDDGGFYSVYLPFRTDEIQVVDAVSGAEWEVLAFDEWTADGVKMMKQSLGTTQTAYKPMLLRGKGSGNEVTLRFVGAEQTIAVNLCKGTASMDGQTIWGGTLNGMNIEDGQVCYAPSNDGNRLVRVATGSWLRPFRGCVWRENNAECPQYIPLFKDAVTYINKVEIERDGVEPLRYTLDGKPVQPYDADGKTGTRIRRGLYVTKGRCVWIP